MAELIHILFGYESFHHRVTQSITEFNRFEIKRIELRDTLCYSVVKSSLLFRMEPEYYSDILYYQSSENRFFTPRRTLQRKDGNKNPQSTNLQLDTEIRTIILQ